MRVREWVSGRVGIRRRARLREKMNESVKKVIKEGGRGKKREGGKRDRGS